MKQLLIGCGSSRIKKMYKDNSEWDDLVTLDINKDHKPDVVWDLNNLPLPFKDNEFDEIHAYEVLEHTGGLGDYKFFFAQFEDFWRMLKDKGLFLATVPLPNSVWAFGDPSHKRLVTKEQLTFLQQKAYEQQVGKTTISDFRNIYKADYDVLETKELKESLAFVLKAKK